MLINPNVIIPRININVIIGTYKKGHLGVKYNCMLNIEPCCIYILISSIDLSKCKSVSLTATHCICALEKLRSILIPFRASKEDTMKDGLFDKITNV